MAVQKPSWTEGGGQVCRARDPRCECKGTVGPDPQTPVSPTSPTLGMDARKSWCSLRVTDGPCTQKEAAGYESRFDVTVLPEGGVSL